MIKKLFLDDFRIPMDCILHCLVPINIRSIYNSSDWVIVRNYKEFVDFIVESGMPDFISFDHDLADIHYSQDFSNPDAINVEKTGYDCAKWLINYCMDNNLKLPNFVVHSQNPVGKKNIESILFNFKKTQV